jgi:hypothetical protein
MHEPRHTDISYENTDVNVTPVVMASLFILFLTIVVMVLLSSLVNFVDTQAATPIEEPSIILIRPTVPAPRLQPNPIDNRTPLEDMELLLQTEAEILNSTEIIDQENGVVRIPIDMAIEVLSERGLPTPAPAP